MFANERRDNDSLGLVSGSAVSAARYSHIRHEGCYHVSPCKMRCCNVECATYLSVFQCCSQHVRDWRCSGLCHGRPLCRQVTFRVISIFYERQVSINVSNLCTHTQEIIDVMSKYLAPFQLNLNVNCGCNIRVADSAAVWPWWPPASLWCWAGWSRGRPASSATSTLPGQSQASPSQSCSCQRTFEKFHTNFRRPLLRAFSLAW